MLGRSSWRIMWRFNLDVDFVDNPEVDEEGCVSVNCDCDEDQVELLANRTSCEDALTTRRAR
jgi:hypothetical protein